MESPYTSSQEWHFHVYFFQSNNVSVTAANNLRNQLLELVQNHYLVGKYTKLEQ